MGETKNPGPLLKKEVEELKIWSINVGGAPGLFRRPVQIGWKNQRITARSGDGPRNSLCAERHLSSGETGVQGRVLPLP